MYIYNVCMYLYTYIYMNHFAVHNKHNIVNQLYFNKIMSLFFFNPKRKGLLVCFRNSEKVNVT